VRDAFAGLSITAIGAGRDRFFGDGLVNEDACRSAGVSFDVFP
jgi:hypothetical protein